MTFRRVVITGLGCVSPIGIGKNAFFDALVRGKSGISQIGLFSPADLPCRIAGEVKEFQPADWLPEKTLPHVPRTVPLAVAAASEALKDAKLAVDTMALPERQVFGVIIGSGGGAVEFIERHYELYYSDQFKKASVYAIPSGTMGTLSSELSMCFNLRGVSHVVSTGCTSSTDALGYAYQVIQTGRQKRVLCGGVDAPLTHGTLSGFCLMRVVTCSWNHRPDQGSRPFSRDRDGFVLGEGAWMFVLEELDLALSRGAHIYAEIKGYGATCEAFHRVRLDESGDESARAMQLALDEAGISPDALDYINLHGTSTQLNDRIETRAVHKLLGRAAYRVPTSSVKSFIGHPQGASGAAGVAATLCAMEKGILPPTLNLDEPDPECDLDYVPDLGRKAQVEWALGNCLGFGSKNSAVLLKRYG